MNAVPIVGLHDLVRGHLARVTIIDSWRHCKMCKYVFCGKKTRHEQQEVIEMRVGRKKELVA
jgi:hypothetical protein